MAFNKYGVFAVALLAAMSQWSFAHGQSAGLAGDLNKQRGAAAYNGPTLGGDVNIGVDVGDVTVQATDGSTAAARIGAITSGAVAGDTNIKVRANDVKVTAERDSCAEALIGAIGTPACSN